MGYGEDDSTPYCSRFTNHSIQHFSIIRLSSSSSPLLTHLSWSSSCLQVCTEVIETSLRADLYDKFSFRFSLTAVFSSGLKGTDHQNHLSLSARIECDMIKRLCTTK